MRELDGQPRELSTEIYSAKVALGAGLDGLDLLYILRETSEGVTYQKATLPEAFQQLGRAANRKAARDDPSNRIPPAGVVLYERNTQ